MEEKKETLVYVPMAADIIHAGHLNIINIAQKLGTVVVGLFTDEAIATYKRVPFMKYEMREKVVMGLKGVSKVIPQVTKDYEENLRKLKPKYMVHGTDWREGPLQKVRQKAIDIMEEWGGEVVEPEYTQGVSSTALKGDRNESSLAFKAKAREFTEELTYQKGLSGIYVYDAFSARLVEKVKTSSKKEYASLWIDADELFRVHQKSHQQKFCMSDYLAILERLNSITKKPLIAPDISQDMDDFSYLLFHFQKMGLASIIIHADELLAAKLALFTQNSFAPDFKIVLALDSSSKLDLLLFKKYRLIINAILLDAKDTQIATKLEDLDVPLIYLLDEDSQVTKDYQYKVYKNTLCRYAEKILSTYLHTLLA